MNDQTSSNQENTDHDNMNVDDDDLDINEDVTFSSNENEDCTNVALNEQTKPIIANKSIYESGKNRSGLG